MNRFKISSIVVVLVLAATSVFAQSETDAINAYNKGLEEVKANNFDSAISSLTQAHTIAEQLGAEGEDIKNRVESQIPTVYLKKAVSIYSDYQRDRSVENLNLAIDAFREAESVGDEYNKEQVMTRAKGVIPQLFYQKALLFYSQEDFEKSDEAVDKALNLNSNYATAYYQKAKIIKKINDTDADGIIDENIDELLDWYDRAITTGEATGKMQVVEKARESAHDELLAVGTNASEDGNLDYAIELLSKGLDYNAQSANLHYRLSEAYNKQGDAENAITYSQRALEYENGGRTDKAKIYYELGYAHQTLGNKTEACDAFSNALYGSFKSPAEHKMEYELKCDTTAK